MRDKHGGVSRAQGYRLIKRSWQQIHEDIEGPDLDRQEMLAWCVHTLLETAGQAKAQRNPGAVVSAIRQLDWMCGLGITHTRGTGSTVRGYDLASEGLSLETAGFAGLINVLITLALSIFGAHVVLGIGVIVWTGADLNELNLGRHAWPFSALVGFIASQFVLHAMTCRA